MKSILLPVDENEQITSAFETARLAARMFDGAVEGAALSPAFTEIVAADPIVRGAIPPHDWKEAEDIRRGRRPFDNSAMHHTTGTSETMRSRGRARPVIRGAN